MDAGEIPRNRSLTVEVERLRPQALLPRRMSEGASGWDLCACLEEEVRIEPGRWTMVPTGIALEIPEGYEAQVRARSGLAVRHGLGLLNAPGTIDSDYRGEVCVILMNWGTEPFVIHHGDRIAQLVFSRVEPVNLRWSRSLLQTSRGAGGFGHTGIDTAKGKRS
jgi:dUTP pyrophosphatase